MSHYQHCVLFAHLGELGGQGLHGSSNIVILTFLALPIHQRGTKGCMFEIIFMHLVNGILVSIFHAGNDIQGGHGYAGIAFLFQLGKGFFGSRIGNAFIGLDAVNNDVGGKGCNHLYTGMSCLDGFHGSINGFGTCILKGGTKAHHNDGRFVR